MAGRYATALFELAKDNRAIDAVLGDLDRLDSLIADNPDLSRLVRSPIFTAEEQSRAINAILAKAEISGIAANFVNIVVQNRRLFALREMVRAYRGLVARDKGEVRAEVIAAERLSDTQLAAINDTLKSATGKDVIIDVQIDPSIIGGLIVKLGSRMVDTSLRTKLNSLKIAMKEVG